MKKLFLAVLCLNGLFASAQFTLKTLDGTTINNGDVLTFNGLAEPTNYLGFKFYNNTSSVIRIKAQVISISNFDPGSADTNALCLDPFCNYNVAVGSTYNDNNPLVIPANGTNGNFDYFENMNAGLDPNLPLEYVLKLYQLSDSGGDSGISVTFTYRYSATLSVNNFGSLANAGISIKSTVVHNQFEVKTLKSTLMEMYDMNGKVVGNHQLIAGENAIDASMLSAGMYIANFKNDAGLVTSAKFLKK